MDQKKSTIENFSQLPPAGKVISTSQGQNTFPKLRPTSKKNHYHNNHIVYTSNPLYGPDNSLENNKKEDVFFRSDSINETHTHCCDDLFFPPLKFGQCDGKQDCKAKQKRRKDTMKARAERRRDILAVDESSDEDVHYSNSTDSLNNRQKTIDMDEAYNRRSRTARTERYLRRLSKDDPFSTKDECRNRNASNIAQERKNVPVSQFHPVPMPRFSLVQNRRRSIAEGEGNLFYNNYDRYQVPRTDPIAPYNENYPPDPYAIDSIRRPLPQNRHTSLNVGYDKIRWIDCPKTSGAPYRSDSQASSHAFDSIRYVEPRISNCQQGNPYYKAFVPQPRPRDVRTSSFQDKIPADYPRRASSMVTDKNSRVKNAKPESSWYKATSNSSNSLPRSSVSHFSATRVRKISPPKTLLSRDETPSEIDSSKQTSGSKSTSLSTMTNVTSDAKRDSMKRLGKQLSELEKMYNNLRLSDDNLLERAEERCKEELSQKISQNNARKDLARASDESSDESSCADELRMHKYATKESNENHILKDDMAFRKMQSSKLSPNSESPSHYLSQISYLLASSTLLDDDLADSYSVKHKSGRETPDVTKDDVVYRNLQYTNNMLKIVDPQPPFGIPLRPVPSATTSNYLASTPTTPKSPGLKYVPQAEPNLVTDDLAFRNLRKDTPKSPASFSDNSEKLNNFLVKNGLDMPSSEETFYRKKKKAVRSLSANLYGLINRSDNLELNVA